MATPIEHVYRKFLGMIEDEEWLLIEDEVIEDLMLNYLENATVEFTQCKKDLSIDYNNMEFVEDLTLQEIMILAYCMMLHYLQPKIRCQDNLKQMIGDKDFAKLSNANMLLRLQGLERATRKQIEVYQSKYCFKNFEGWN